VQCRRSALIWDEKAYKTKYKVKWNKKEHVLASWQLALFVSENDEQKEISFERETYYQHHVVTAGLLVEAGR
jgi:hypothetical protein